MNLKHKLVLSMALGIALFGMACSSGLQKANGLVDEANKNIDEAKTLSETASKKYGDAQDKIGPNYPADLDSFKALAQEAMDNFDKASKKLKDASAKFDEASKLAIPEKFKDYLTTEASEFGKRSEILVAMKANAQALLDAKDFPELKTRIDGNDAKAALLEKEAAELNLKAKKIQTDNPDMFKK